jgi:hypothetical protein
VSIKKKFATAVATASLLAGLFGSAFVPSAYGAGRPAPVADPVPPKASLTVLTTGAAVDKETGKNNFGYLSSESSAAVSGATANIIVAINSAGNADLTTADLRATSSNDDITVAWAYEADGTEDSCADMDSAGEDSFSDEDIVEEVVDLAAGAGTYSLCLASADTDTAATSTVTIYAAEAGTSADDGWVLLKTVTVTAIGPTDSMALSIADGYKYVMEENAAVSDWLTIACRDENGTLINNGTGTISVGNDCGTVVEATTNPKNGADVAINFIDDATNGADAVTGAKSDWDLNAQTCNNSTDADETDAGSSYSLKVAIGTVVSNAVSITCTGSDARISKVTITDAVGPQVYDDGSGDDNSLDIMAVVVDEEGRPFGDGANDLDFGVLAFDGDADVVTELETNDLDLSDVDVTELVGGEILLSHIDDGFDFGRRGKFTISVEISEPDLGDADEDALEGAVVYTASASESVTIAKTMAAGKRSATITVEFGEDSAYARAAFFVENSNGVVKEYLRRANAEGVATFKLARRKATFYVFADLDAGGAPTDILEIKFK